MKRNTTNDGLINQCSLIPSSIKMFFAAMFMAMTFSCTVAYVPVFTPEVPNWAPAYDNTNKAQYYYLPDIECYYDVKNRDFIYLENSQWMFTNTLPPSYDWYDLNNCYTVILDTRVNEPWMHFSYYVSHYPRYYYRSYYRDRIHENKRVWGYNENDKKEVYSQHGQQPSEGHYYNGEHNNNTPQYNNQYNYQGYQGTNGQGYPQQNNQQSQGQNTPPQNNGQYSGQHQNTAPVNNQHQGTTVQPNNPPNHPGTQTGTQQGSGQATAPHPGGQPATGQGTPHQNGGNNGQNNAGQPNQGAYETPLPATEQPHPNHIVRPNNLTPTTTPTEAGIPAMNNNHPGGNNNGNNQPAQGQGQNPLPATEAPHPTHGNNFPVRPVIITRPAEDMKLNDKNVGKPVKVKKDMLRPQP